LTLSDISQDLVLDGNAIAGLLEETLGTDATAAPHTCGDCGRTHEIGRHRLYRSAGFVLRCPSCGTVAMRIAPISANAVVQFGVPAER
jgi:predicted RNA-binding Zn-ribbon protein involved in translation (DUF1610 family)